MVGGRLPRLSVNMALRLTDNIGNGFMIAGRAIVIEIPVRPFPAAPPFGIGTHPAGEAAHPAGEAAHPAGEAALQLVDTDRPDDQRIYVIAPGGEHGEARQRRVRSRPGNPRPFARHGRFSRRSARHWPATAGRRSVSGLALYRRRH
ncbi:hypothetical protein [Actinoplanes sp. NPDC026619]|uniref:hypothetical protein n=1 Tax=Actinoplanes sp. NPDC026619 TaxID=3155798 RepID=UPI00340274D7